MPHGVISSRHGTFGEVATEYYDATRHPTCANLRQASGSLIEQALARLDWTNGWICDVGCGQSVVAEILDSWGQPLDRLILCDSAAAMLEHSRRWRGNKATLVVGDAEGLPLADRSVGILVASLGDSFNQPSFWRE